MIDYQKDDEGIAHIVWNNPEGPVNIKSPKAMAAFVQAVDLAIGDDSVKGVLIRSAKRDFVAGGDLMALYAVKTAEAADSLLADIRACLRRMERCSKPFVAVLHGSALGGGLELALACHYRIAVDDPALKLGLPETTLGLIPGAGATQRLPRLMGITPAAEMLIGGRPIGAREAFANGLIDELVLAGQEVQAARRMAQAHPIACQAWDAPGFQYPGFQPGSGEAAAFFDSIRERTQSRWPAEDLAPHTVIEVLAEGVGLALDQALMVEAQHFCGIAISACAKNHIRTQFIAPGVVRKAAHSNAANTLKPSHAGVVGAGTMGAGIALVTAQSGIQTVLIDQSPSALKKAIERMSRALDSAVERKQMTALHREETLARIGATTDFSRLQGCQVVVEAVVEVPEVKNAVFRQILSAAGPEVVLASNTSTLSITSMAKSVGQAPNVIGLHFFAPVDRMALVEVILGEQTSARTLAISHALLQAMGKTPVVVKDGPGFYTSRVVAAYTREALHMLGEGVAPELIDSAARTAGFAIGPLVMGDLTSYDLLKDILGSLQRAACGTAVDSQGALDAIDRLLEAGRSGRKGLGGVYDHGPQGPQVWGGLAALFPANEVQPAQADVMERLLNIQSIETAHVMAEGIASDPLALDLAAVLGWSYPAFRGGVLAHMDDLGISHFVQRCDAMAQSLGPRFVVPELLRDMASRGATFHAGPTTCLTSHG